ncbi:hypothetical protein [Mycolicibacterium baixiangningiae]|uniref:hypothetical protein n=1 Tax=Mycolicibacterium baixiangningiae TaxID=2761578 RepID=UPI0018664C05|nr:hypothetical protein [Mycolicibacterium baixiangningiae]
MKSPIAVAFLCIVFAPFGIFCLTWTLRFVMRGEYLSAVVALGFAVFTLGLVAMLLSVASRKVAPRVTYDDGAVMVRPDKKVDGSLMASTVGAYVAMAVYAVFAPLAMLDVDVPSGNQRYFVFICAAGLFVGVLSLRQIIWRRGTSYLRLTVDGVETGNTMTSVKRPWEEIADIADRAKKEDRPTGTTYIVGDDGRMRELPTDWYTPGGGDLREFLRFYWQHPEHRSELTDGSAAARLRSQARGA